MTKIVGYDITIFKTEIDTSAKLFQFLNSWCKKWVCIGETCPTTGAPHWQCRVHLWSALDPKTLKNKRASGEISAGHWTPTSSEVHLGCNFNYVMKLTSAIPGEGPWTNKDEVCLKPAVLTRQLKYFMEQELYPWQQQVLKWCAEEDDRSIKVIVDENGDSGKSIMAEFLEYHRKAYEVEPFDNMEDIMGCVIQHSGWKAYLIDIPRALRKDKVYGFYSGLETLKNGKAFDKRYSFQRVRFDRPQVIVFTNEMPDVSMMTKNRWQIYRMDWFMSLNSVSMVEAQKEYKRTHTLTGRKRKNGIQEEEDCSDLHQD